MKPKVFISSTVLDFEDLRGALKYFLEGYYYEVQMSEYPDFDVEPSDSIYDNCIKSLSKCDYFILLIGYRRGHWYKANEISITNLEYRAAKYLIENGSQLKIISFVRKPIFILKYDRDGLIKHFKDKSIELSKEIKETGSTVIDDPDYIFNFLNEVSEGIKFPNTENPTNNWIYDFNNFSEIATGLKHTFKIDSSLEEKRIKSQLIRELENNYNKFMIPDPGISQPKDAENFILKSLLDILKEKFESRLIDENNNLLFPNNQFYTTDKEFGVLWLHSFIIPLQIGLKYIKTSILNKVVDEGTYLKFDISSGEFKINLLSLALEKISVKLNDFRDMFSAEVYKEFYEELNKIAYSEKVNQPKIYFSVTVAGVLLNIIKSHKIPHLIDAILDALKNDDYQKLIDFDFN